MKLKTTFSVNYSMNNLLLTLLLRKKSKTILLTLIFTFFLNSCSTIESGWNSITDAGTYVYDSAVGLWEDEEPEENEAVVIEEVYEIPNFDTPNMENDFANQYNNPNDFNMQQNELVPQFYDPVYRSARQYYSVSPNGSPLPAPPPPPFPQYSIEPNDGYYGFTPTQRFGFGAQTENSFGDNLIINENVNGNNSNNLSEEERMELYGIENNCIRVTNDYMNGGYKCDDFD